MKEKSGKVVGILFLIVFVAYMLITGIGDLINTKDVKTLHVDYAVSALDVEHSINGLIPTGTDHYFLIVDSQTNEGAFVRASKSWYTKNFDDSGQAKTSGGIDVTALAKKPDYKIVDELVLRAGQLNGLTFAVGPDTPLDLKYKINAVMRILVVVLGALMTVMVVMISKAGKEVSAPVKLVFGVIAIAFLILILIVIR